MNNIGRALLTGALLAAVLHAAPAFADETGTISGTGQAIDSDIIVIDKQRVILWSVDAPDLNQDCLLNHAVYDCYTPAANELQLMLQQGPVNCQLTSNPDPFKRHYGICKVGDLDLGAELIRKGLAIDFDKQSKMYMDQQNEAKAAKIGLWQPGMEFEKPWVYRAKRNAQTR